MADRSLARLLAPLALIASVVGVAVVVLISDTSTTGQISPTARTTTTHESRPATPRARSYVVKPGDNLTLIAERTHVSVETLEELNPDADPQALRAGQRLKLTP